MKFTLRPWKTEDRTSLVKHANNYNIAKFLTNQFPYPYTERDAEVYIDMVKDASPSNVLAIEINGDAVGSIGVFPQQDLHCKNAEMGYWLSEKFWGKGIMTNVIKEMIEYGFANFDIDRIYARPFGINKASQKVLEKAGFTLEARLKNVLYKNGIYMDELIYAIRK